MSKPDVYQPREITVYDNGTLQDIKDARGRVLTAGGSSIGIYY